MELKDIRKKIDVIDQEVLGLLAERMEMALQTRRFKGDVRDGSREAQVLERALRYSRASATLPSGFVEKLFNSIMEESRRLQGEGGRLVGFQGERGAYGEEAAGRFDPSLVPVPCAEFSDVFDNVESGALDLGIVPVENSSAGPVVQVGPLWPRRPLKISGGLVPGGPWPAAAAGDRPPSIRKFSILRRWPVPRFPGAPRLEGVPYYDTAARPNAAVERPPMAAVLAGRRCADLYGWTILKEEAGRKVYVNPSLLSREERTEGATLLVNSRWPQGRALFDSLKIFARGDEHDQDRIFHQPRWAGRLFVLPRLPEDDILGSRRSAELLRRGRSC